MKRRKPDAARKDESIRILVTAEQKATLAAAAERAGLDLSSWLRSIGLREAVETRNGPELQQQNHGARTGTG